MRERIESKHVTKEIKSRMPVIPVEIVKERGCTFCPYYLGNYEKQPRCMMKTCAWDDENERFHPVLRGLIPFYKEKMEKAEEKFLAMKKIYTTLLGMFADEMKQEELEKDECCRKAVHPSWWYLWASKIGCYESPCIVTGGAVMHDQIQA